MCCARAACSCSTACRAARSLRSIPRSCPKKDRSTWRAPRLAHFTATRDELLARTSALFGMIAEGKLKVQIAKTYPLRGSAAGAPRHGSAGQIDGEVVADSVML